MDTLRKVLKYNGYELNHVMNITDVGHLTSDADEGEDKMEKSAKEKNMSIRFIPLFVKNIIIKAIYKKEGKSTTSVLSNLGKIEVPDEFEKYIDHFSFMLNSTESEAVKCGVCSFGDKIVCTFTSKFENSYLERTFFRYLQSEGIDIVIESNGVRNEEL